MFVNFLTLHLIFYLFKVIALKLTVLLVNRWEASSIGSKCQKVALGYLKTSGANLSVIAILVIFAANVIILSGCDFNRLFSEEHHLCFELTGILPFYLFFISYIVFLYYQRAQADFLQFESIMQIIYRIESECYTK